jgi:hypothetical protein
MLASLVVLEDGEDLFLQKNITPYIYCFENLISCLGPTPELPIQIY